MYLHTHTLVDMQTRLCKAKLEHLDTLRHEFSQEGRYQILEQLFESLYGVQTPIEIHKLFQGLLESEKSNGVADVATAAFPRVIDWGEE